MRKLAMFFTALVFSGAALAQPQTTYTWDVVNKRINDTPVEHPVTYVLIHNGVAFPTDQNTIVVEGHPNEGTQSCVSAIENYPSGLKLQSEQTCVAINAKPSKPEFQMIQLINLSGK